MSDAYTLLKTLDFHQMGSRKRCFAYKTADGRMQQDWFFNPQLTTDYYFSPLRYTEERRSNDTVDQSSMCVLFADLDDAPPVPHHIFPSILWETSPGMKQAVWILSGSMNNYAEWSALNRDMTYHTGADRGGWMGSKLLRMPDTLNWKRATGSSIPRVHIVSASFRVFDRDEMREMIPPYESKRLGDIPEYARPPLISGPERDELLNGLWQFITLSTRSMLMQDRVRDRSLHIVRTLHKLREDGISRESAFHLVWWCPWNKWRTDRYDPNMLWKETLTVWERP